MMFERYILECIKYGVDDKGRKIPVRQMYGVSMSFDMVHWSMEQIKDQWDDIIIHQLHSLPRLVDDVQVMVVKTRRA